MKRISSQIQGQPGFTLMELLIVIGVLGILAAGLLAAIDPFEQLKKARDSNYRSGAIEFLSATQRYYANHGYMPWRNSGSACATDNAGTLAPDPAVASLAAAVVTVGVGQSSDFASCIDDLVSDGELKSTFSQGLNTSIYLSSWSKTNMRVCYAPESKSNRSDAQVNMHLDEDDALVLEGCDSTTRDKGKCVQCFQ